MAHSSGQTGLMPQLLETPKRERSLKDASIVMQRNCSWNRAFFTNDGLLDDEELESIIEGGGKDVKHQVQGSEEKLCRSTGSVSTSKSDNLALESLEAKLFKNMEASTQNSSRTSNLTNSNIRVSSGEGDPKANASRFSQKGTQATKVIGAVGLRSPVPRTSLSPLGPNPIKTEATRASPLGGSSSGDDHKSSAALARKGTTSKTVKATADSTSKTPPGNCTKSKLAPVNPRLPSHLVVSNLSPRTSPASSISQWSSGSSSAVNQRSSRGSSSAPHRSSVNTEKSSTTNARRKDDQKIGKPVVGSIAKTPSSISLKNKPPPVNSPSTSVASSICQRPSQSSSSSSTSTGNHRSISRGHHRSLNRDASVKPTLKNHPTAQTPERNGRKSAASRPQTGPKSQSPPVQSTGRGMPSTKSGFFEEGKSYKSRLLNGLTKNSVTHSKIGSAKARPAKTVAAGQKPNSQKTTTTTTSTTRKASQKQASGKAKPSNSALKGTHILLMSPEVLDIKGKINSLRMEISNQNKDKSKEMKAQSSRDKAMNSSHHVGINRKPDLKKKNDQIPYKATK